MTSSLFRVTALIIAAVALAAIAALTHGHASSVADGFGWGINFSNQGGL